MRSLCKRLLLETEDWLRYHPRVRALIGRYKLLRTRRNDPHDPQSVARTIAQLCAAARLSDDPAAERRIQRRIAVEIQQLDVQRLDWSEFVPEFRERHIAKAAILKPWVGPTEKGVVFISFEREWIKVLNRGDVRDFAERYTLVIAPSSSPHNLVNYAFPAAYPGPIFTLISNPHDADVLPGVSSKLIVLPLYASHWVNPELYAPMPKAERPYDLLMVASWGKVKRHQVLFKALQTMPRELRVLLVGQDQEGRTAETIRELARWYGVADRFTTLSNQPYREVAKLFCQARASVVLSKCEGSCVVVAESLFADAPVALLRGAEIGSRVFINEHTGRFVEEHTLAQELTELIQNAERYQARAWAEANISCWRSTLVLNDALKQHALAARQAWTLDIAPLQWSPDPRLARSKDQARLATEREEIARRFGWEIGLG